MRYPKTQEFELIWKARQALQCTKFQKSNIIKEEMDYKKILQRVASTILLPADTFYDDCQYS